MSRFWMSQRIRRILHINNRKPESLRTSRKFDFLPLPEKLDPDRVDLNFDAVENPLVSIVIPVHNKIEYTYNCLMSVKSATADISYEVIVVDDCSYDNTQEVLSRIRGVRYLRNESNAGFIRSCNLGATHANGKYICLLNNDTQVLPGWLTSVSDLLERDSEVGAVGSKLIFGDGYLQEAGGIVWRDASGANYGRGHDPFLPDYNYVREVDYCTGASLTISREDFVALGMLDKRYVPAYYDDTDICFQVRHVLNKKVMYQPSSNVIHFEGITSGTDLSKGAKRHQVVNQNTFYQKWKNELSRYYLPKKIGAYAGATRLTKKKILIIDYQVPRHDQDSGSRRLTHIIRGLKRLGHHVIFMSYHDDMFEDPYVEMLQQLGVEVLYELHRDNSTLDQLFRRLDDIDVAWICRPRMNKKYQPLLRMNKNIRIIYDTVDLHYLRFQKEFELGICKDESWKKYKKMEIKMARSADAVIAITQEEADELAQHVDTKQFVVPNIHAPELNRNPRFDNRSGLLFMGGYAHTPNLDAAIWLLEEIMPQVWKELPEVKLTLLGSNPPERLLKYESDRVSVPGYVADVSEYFNSSRVFVCPLRYGAGMKGKIGQSLEFGLPIVSTSYGVQGMGMVDNEHYLLANSKDEMVDRILSLHNDAALWKRLHEGSDEVLEVFSPAQVEKKLEAILG